MQRIDPATGRALQGAPWRVISEQNLSLEMGGSLKSPVTPGTILAPEREPGA